VAYSIACVATHIGGMRLAWYKHAHADRQCTDRVRVMDGWMDGDGWNTAVVRLVGLTELVGSGDHREPPGITCPAENILLTFPSSLFALERGLCMC
jgi:hypothetical protein